MVDWTRYALKEAVVFIEDVAKKLRFTDLSEATIQAHKEGAVTTIPMATLILGVNSEDDKPVMKKWYIASKKAVMTMKPYIEDGTFRRRVFTITKHGKAPASWFEITAGPVLPQ